MSLIIMRMLRMRKRSRLRPFPFSLHLFRNLRIDLVRLAELRYAVLVMQYQPTSKDNADFEDLGREVDRCDADCAWVRGEAGAAWVGGEGGVGEDRAGGDGEVGEGHGVGTVQEGGWWWGASGLTVGTDWLLWWAGLGEQDEVLAGVCEADRAVEVLRDEETEATRDAGKSFGAEVANGSGCCEACFEGQSRSGVTFVAAAWRLDANELAVAVHKQIDQLCADNGTGACTC